MKINALLPTVQKADAPYRGPAMEISTWSKLWVDASKTGGLQNMNEQNSGVLTFWDFFNVPKTNDLTQPCSMIQTIEVFFVLSVLLPAFLYWSWVLRLYRWPRLPRSWGNCWSWFGVLAYAHVVWIPLAWSWNQMWRLLNWRDVVVLIRSLGALVLFSVFATTLNRTNGTCLSKP